MKFYLKDILNDQFLGSKKFLYFFSISLFLILLFKSLSFHNSIGINHFRSTIFADPGGYYHFLPSTFYAHYNAELIPDDAIKKSGGGFSVVEGKIISKYPYGVALLQLPFFAAADLYARLAGYETNGYSKPYFKLVNWATSFYGSFGIFLLFAFLKKQFQNQNRVILLSLLVVIFGTNFFYYAVYSPGYSHVYSFFLFAAFIYLLQKWQLNKSNNAKTLMLLSIIAGTILVVRSMNILFVVMSLAFFNVKNLADFKLRLLDIFNAKTLLIFVIPALIVLMPQLIYNNYAFGNFFSNGYIEETFDFKNPKLWYHLTDSLNGTILYTPTFLVSFVGLILIWIKPKKEWFWLLPFFIILVYINASWHSWWFGCGFGMRVYVEYYVLLIIPLFYLFKSIPIKIAAVIAALLITYNLFLTVIWPGCYFEEKHNYEPFFNLIKKGLKIN